MQSKRHSAWLLSSLKVKAEDCTSPNRHQVSPQNPADAAERTLRKMSRAVMMMQKIQRPAVTNGSASSPPDAQLGLKHAASWKKRNTWAPQTEWLYLHWLDVTPKMAACR